MPTDIVNSTMREAGYCAAKLSECLSCELLVDLSCQVMDEISFFLLICPCSTEKIPYNLNIELYDQIYLSGEIFNDFS
jgi:hypothetical protein